MQPQGIKQECIICCENERDTLYMPCRHNAACMRCSKNLEKCPICKIVIDDLIKIFKSWVDIYSINFLTQIISFIAAYFSDIITIMEKPKIAHPYPIRVQLEPNKVYRYCTCGLSKT